MIVWSHEALFNAVLWVLCTKSLLSGVCWGLYVLEAPMFLRGLGPRGEVLGNGREPWGVLGKIRECWGVTWLPSNFNYRHLNNLNRTTAPILLGLY